MSFRFPLEAVLHFRQSLEHQQELRLRTANQAVARLSHLIEQVDNGKRQLRDNQSRELRRGTTSAEICFALGSESAFAVLRLKLGSELALAQKVRDEQRLVFAQARRQRQTLESLRKVQLEKYKRGAAQQQQRALDDLFLLRRAHLPHG
jgi:flagellar export protein FliJ